MAKAKAKTSRTKLLHKKHTGKLRSHRHTSYGFLAFFLVVLAFLPLLLVSRTVSADQADYQTYAVVLGPVPKSPPVITSPNNGTVFTTNDPIRARGTCPDKTLVKIFKNEVLSGATLCQNGIFDVQLDLFVGANNLVARAYNANDVSSPDSAAVNVKLVPSGVNLNGSELLNSATAPANQFYITSQVYYHGVNAGENLNWSLSLIGGQAPYAVSVSWGDGKTDLISRGAAGQLQISHAYAHGPGERGSYTVVVKATDQSGNKSFLQLVALVNGSKQPSIIGSVGGGYGTTSSLRMAWQLLALGAVAVLSFWIGEKREVTVLKRRAA